MSTVVEDLVANLRLKPDEGSWARGNKLVTGIKAGIAAFVASKVIGEIGEVVHHIADAVEETVHFGSELHDTAEKTGLTVEALQRLGYVAKLNGSSMEGATTGIKFFSRSLVEAQGGSKEAIESFKKLGISVNDKAFKELPLEGQFRLLAERISKLPDGAEKTSLALKVLGRSGTELIPTLNELGKNGAELDRQFEELGGGLSTEQAKNLDEFGDDIDRTKMSLSNLKNQVIAGLVPSLAEALKGFREWIQQNRELIKQGIATVVSTLVKVVKALGAAFVVLSDWYQENKETITTYFTLVAGTVKILFKWLGLTLRLLGLVLRTALSLAGGLISAFKGAWEGIKAVGQSIADFFTETIPNAIKNAFKAMWDSIVSGAVAAWNTIKNLPVIKQVLKYGGKVVGGVEDALGGGPKGEPGLPPALQQFVPSAPTTAGGGPTAMVQGGPTTININGAQDPAAIQGHVQRAVEQANNNMLLQARENFG